jgi:hypothetical protein
MKCVVTKVGCLVTVVCTAAGATSEFYNIPECTPLDLQQKQERQQFHLHAILHNEL